MWAEQPSPRHMTKTRKPHTEAAPTQTAMWVGKTSLLAGAQADPAEGAAQSSAPGGLRCKSPGESYGSQQGALPCWELQLHPGDCSTADLAHSWVQPPLLGLPDSALVGASVLKTSTSTCRQG